MAISKSIQALLSKDFKEDAKISKISEDLKGKVIVVYGRNNLGKTKQASKLKNPIFIPCEKGLNAISGAVVLKTTSWNDMRRHAKRLSGRKWMDLLKQEGQITIIIDGIEKAGLYCRDYIASKHGVTDVADAKGGFGAWKQYEDEMIRWVDSIISLGYTVVFLGHESYDKKLDKAVIKGDERNIAPIRDNADIVVYLKSNGIDDNGDVVPSSGYLAESDEYFARTRFTYMDTYIEEYTAENLEKVIVEGIKRQNEAEGNVGVSFEEQQEIYASEEEDIEDVKEDIRELYEKLKEITDDENIYWDIVEEHLGADGSVSEATKKQLEALLCIRDDMEFKIEELEDER